MICTLCPSKEGNRNPLRKLIRLQIRKEAMKMTYLPDGKNTKVICNLSNIVFLKFEIYNCITSKLFWIFLDNDGPYYWHIKSGTIQREPPTLPFSEKIIKSNNKFSTDSDLIAKFDSVTISSVTRSSTSSALDADLEERKRKDELALK